MIRLINSLRVKDDSLWVNKEGQLHKVNLCDVYYFEAVEKKVFLYTKDQVFEVKEKLYQLEEKYQGTHYIRVSKSVILNIEKIELITPTFNGRLIVKLKNSEKISISRNYVRNLKIQLGVDD
ncbi:LytTR family DNA-binding domain-containing protein [Enterococcus florum]|nr:LytTR family DNA-binding domain-containing protein [Enterococcus florum]